MCTFWGHVRFTEGISPQQIPGREGLVAKMFGQSVIDQLGDVGPQTLINRLSCRCQPSLINWVQPLWQFVKAAEKVRKLCTTQQKSQTELFFFQGL